MSGAGRPGVTRVVVLAAGRGTRMREAADVVLTPAQAAAADRGLKTLMPIHGRPFLAYVLDEVAAAGFEEACLVVGPRGAAENPDAPDPIRAAAETLDSPLRLRFAVQSEPRGGADAVLAAEGVVGNAPFVVINADNLYPAAVLRLLRDLDGPGLAAFERTALVRESNIPPERVGAFALLSARDGWLERIIEKPAPDVVERMPDAPVSMTAWRFDATIFDACRDVAPSTRGELELPDAVALALSRGVRFRLVPVCAGVLDISRRADIPALERLLAGGGHAGAAAAGSEDWNEKGRERGP